MQYFAYGSNMLTERLRARVPSADPLNSARLPGQTLRFHKRSKDGSGKCTLVEASEASATVYGVLFDIDSRHLSALDEAEHRGQGYERRRVELQVSGEPVGAIAYVAQPAYVDEALRPYDWYHTIVMAGAHQHALPAGYRAQLEDVRTYPDPDASRRARYQSLLREVGYFHL